MQPDVRASKTVACGLQNSHRAKLRIVRTSPATSASSANAFALRRPAQTAHDARHQHRRGDGAGDDGRRRRRAALDRTAGARGRAQSDHHPAGNWQPKKEDSGEAVAHQGDAGDTLTLPVPELAPHSADGPRSTSYVAIAFHPEDDPMEKHDHPLARQRLGDLEAGLGSAATLSFDDAEAIRDLAGVQYVACGVHGNARVLRRRQALVHAHARHRSRSCLDIKRAWTLTAGRFFTAREQENAEQVHGARPGRRRKAVRRRASIAVGRR